MHEDHYPPQEPLSEIGARYAAECRRLSAGIAGEEHGYGPDPYQRLLVFPAPTPNGRVLVFWHGGGWTSGYKEWMGFMAPAFTAAGITFVSPGYRLAPAHVFPAGVEDGIAAIRWVHAHIATYGGDPNRISLGGHSAGGHYAALLAVRRDWQDAAGLPVDLVKTCLPLSGVYDFTAAGGLPARPRFLGPDPTETAASPLHRLQPPLPPFLLAYGSRDFPHLRAQAETFAQALRAQGGQAETLVLPDLDHFGASYAGGEADGPWVPRALALLNR